MYVIVIVFKCAHTYAQGYTLAYIMSKDVLTTFSQ